MEMKCIRRSVVLVACTTSLLLITASSVFSSGVLNPAPIVLDPGVPGVCYATTGVGGSDPGSFFTVDVTTGAATLVGATGFDRMPGLAINSAGDIFGSTGGGASSLVRIDATTGAATLIGPMGLAFVDAIAFDEDDILYGIDVSHTLFTFDTATGAPTPVGFTGILETPFLVGLAFQPGTGRLFATTGGLGGFSDLYEIDPATGLATLVGSLGLGGSAIPDIHFVGGSLFGSHNISGTFNLVDISPVTGAGSVVGPFGSGLRISGMAAFSAPIVLDPGVPGVCYATTGRFGTDTGSLFTVDVTTGAATLVGATGFPEMPGLAINSAGDIFGSTILSSLVRIDATTGAATLIGPMGVAFVDAIAFDEDDVLYGIDVSNTLFTFDTATGAPTPVGFTGVVRPPFLVGLAFQPGTGRLFATTGGVGGFSDLYEIDPATGLATLVGSLGLGGRAIPDIHFVGGSLFGSHNISETFNLVDISPVTGAASVVGPFGGGLRISGMAAFLRKVSDLIRPEAKNVAFNPGTMQFSFDLRLKNTSSAPIDAPLHVIFTALTPGPPTITVNNGDGGGEGLGAFFDYSTSLGRDGVLSPGERSDYKTWIFDDPTGVNFTFFVEVYGNAPVPGGGGNKANAVGGGPITVTTDLDNAEINFGGSLTSGAFEPQLPESFALRQNHPNPFNPTTTIVYDLPATVAKGLDVTLKIYNMRGQLIRTLVNEKQEPGVFTVVWDGRNKQGMQAASGVYIYQIVAGQFTKSQKMVLLK